MRAVSLGHQFRTFFFPLILAAILGACGADQIASPGWELAPGAGANTSIVVPDPFFTSIGCFKVAGANRSGSIAVPLQGGGFNEFDCADANPDSLDEGLLHYMEALMAAEPGAHQLLEWYSYQYLGTFRDCSHGYVPIGTYTQVEDGVLTVVTVYSGCEVVVQYQRITHYTNIESDPPPGGTNAPPPPPTAPRVTSVTITPSADAISIGSGVQFKAVRQWSDERIDTLWAGGDWTSSNNVVAYQDDRGYFIGNAPGTVTITSPYSSSATATLQVLPDVNPGMVDIASDTLPDCVSLNPLVIAWCTADLSSATTTRKTRFLQATARMRAKGGICAELANAADSLLGMNFNIRFAPLGSLVGAGSGGSGRGSGVPDLRGGWALFATYLTDDNYNKDRWTTIKNTAGDSLQFDLQTAIAHEMEHVAKGETHISTSALETPNTRACSDITNWLW